MKKAKDLLQTLDVTNRRHGLIEPGDRIVAGVSGGPDSAALLALLGALREKYRLRLYAAHLDHGLSKAARRYAACARRLSERLGVPFFEARANVRRVARAAGRSLEEAGRLERYKFFQTIAQRCGAHKIATAHTRDDQAETILMRLLRGAGLRGLSGIPARRPEGRYTVIRPLLDVE